MFVGMCLNSSLDSREMHRPLLNISRVQQLKKNHEQIKPHSIKSIIILGYYLFSLMVLSIYWNQTLRPFGK